MKKTFRGDDEKHVLVSERLVRLLGIKSRLEPTIFQGEVSMTTLRRYGLVVILTLAVATTALVSVLASSDPARRDIWYWYHCRSRANVTCVSWEVAVRILRSGKVVGVMQSHNLIVSLTLRDGTSIMTVETSIDVIGQEIFLCGDPCKDIRYGTE